MKNIGIVLRTGRLKSSRGPAASEKNVIFARMFT